MKVETKTLYRCDICGKIEPWDKKRWFAHIYSLGYWEDFEFHVCSQECDSKLSVMTRKQRKELAKKIWNY